MSLQTGRASNVAEQSGKHFKKEEPKQPLTMAKVKETGRAWFAEHNGIACIAVVLAFCAIVFGIFLFSAFSDFGGSADFIYNQF